MADDFPFRKNRLPEFSLKDKVIIVSGAGQGLGLVQAEALLEAGAIGKGTVRQYLSTGV